MLCYNKVGDCYRYYNSLKKQKEKKMKILQRIYLYEVKNKFIKDVLIGKKI